MYVRSFQFDLSVPICVSAGCSKVPEYLQFSLKFHNFCNFIVLCSSDLAQLVPFNLDHIRWLFWVVSIGLRYLEELNISPFCQVSNCWSLLFFEADKFTLLGRGLV